METQQELSTLPTLTQPSLELPTDLSFEDWQQVGQKLQAINRHLQWWWGDWLNFGQKAYGDKYTVAVEKFGLNLKTAQQYAWVAREFPSSRRLELSWSHHQAVAGLTDDTERDEILRRAIAEKWTVKALRVHAGETDACVVQSVDDNGDDILESVTLSNTAMLEQRSTDLPPPFQVTMDNLEKKLLQSLKWEPLSADPKLGIPFLETLDNCELTGTIGGTHLITIVPYATDNQYAFMATSDVSGGYYDFTKRPFKRSPGIRLWLSSTIPEHLRTEPIHWSEIKFSNGIESNEELMSHITGT